jgi:6-phosphogluconate dehydrogenase
MERGKSPYICPSFGEGEIILEEKRKDLEELERIAERELEEPIVDLYLKQRKIMIEVKQREFTDEDIEKITKIAEEHDLDVKTQNKAFYDLIHGGLDAAYFFTVKEG